VALFWLRARKTICNILYLKEQKYQDLKRVSNSDLITLCYKHRIPRYQGQYLQNSKINVISKQIVIRLWNSLDYVIHLTSDRLLSTDISFISITWFKKIINTILNKFFKTLIDEYCALALSWIFRTRVGFFHCSQTRTFFNFCNSLNFFYRLLKFISKSPFTQHGFVCID